MPLSLDAMIDLFFDEEYQVWIGAQQMVAFGMSIRFGLGNVLMPLNSLFQD